MTVGSFTVPPDQRYFEDYTPGQVYELGTVTVSEAEIIDFARQFDPQYFHIDPEKARSSRFGRNSVGPTAQVSRMGRNRR